MSLPPWIKTAAEWAALLPEGDPLRSTLAIIDGQAVGWAFGVEAQWPPVGWLVDDDARRVSLAAMLLDANAPECILTRADMASVLVDPRKGDLRMLVALWLHLGRLGYAMEPGPGPHEAIAGALRLQTNLLLTLVWGILAANLFKKHVSELSEAEMLLIYRQTTTDVDAAVFHLDRIASAPAPLDGQTPLTAPLTTPPTISATPLAVSAPGSEAPKAAVALPERPFGFLNRTLEARAAERAWQEQWYGQQGRYL